MSREIFLLLICKRNLGGLKDNCLSLEWRLLRLELVLILNVLREKILIDLVIDEQHRDEAVSATYAPTTVTDTKISESPQQKSNALISYRPAGNSYLKVNLIKDELEMQVANKVLSPRSTNIEETAAQSRVPGQDAVARRAATAKRLEERQRNREKIGQGE